MDEIGFAIPWSDALDDCLTYSRPPRYMGLLDAFFSHCERRGILSQSDNLERNQRVFSCTTAAVQEVYMQQGSLIRSERKLGPAVWQFRWSDRGAEGERIYRKRVIGTVDEYADAEAARRSAKCLLGDPTCKEIRSKFSTMTVRELCNHFQHREPAKDDNWRSPSTRRNYLFCLNRWIIPRWENTNSERYGRQKLNCGSVTYLWLEVLAPKLRNLMSVFFNHAWRYELFDRNPICLVRQSAKRRTAPDVLSPAVQRNGLPFTLSSDSGCIGHVCARLCG